jgi:hypothetical protein
LKITVLDRLAREPAALLLCVLLLATPPVAAAQISKISFAGRRAISPDPPDDPALRSLSNEQLLHEYEAAGLALDGTVYTPIDEAIQVPGRSTSPELTRFELARAQIVIRGNSIVPELLAFVEQEAPKTRPRNKLGLRLSLTGSALGMLASIGDASAAPLMLRILEGFDGRVDVDERRAALGAIEQLTYVCFHDVTPFSGNYADALQHRDALHVDHFADFDVPAKLYRHWLENDGKDPSQWLAIARKRARELLATDDAATIFCAASFLRSSPWPDEFSLVRHRFLAERDDDPDATLASLAKVLRTVKIVSDKTVYEHDSAREPVPISNFITLVARFGPRARPYAREIIHCHELLWHGVFDWAWLGMVGGTELMQYFFDEWPRIEAESKQLAADSNEENAYVNANRILWLCGAREYIRGGIDRWAGRTFDSDADRIAWWQENKAKPPEEWLSSNLSLLMKQANESEGALALGIAWRILPDLPENIDAASRSAWFEKHRAELVYDKMSGAFRLE